jgi:putative hemolysin
VAESSVILFALFFIFMFILSAFFSASETAYSSVNKIRLKRFVEEGRKGSKKALDLAKDFNKTISAILIGGNIVDIVMTSAAAGILSVLMGPIGVVYATLLMTVLIILFGEILPKAFVKDKAENFALGAAAWVYFFVFLLSPLTWLTTNLSNYLRGKSRTAALPSVTHDELLSIVETMGEEGELPEVEKDIIGNAVNFSEIEVCEIQTPRVDLFALNVNEPLENVKNLMLKNHYSRVPIYEGTFDNIIGILNEKDFLNHYINDKHVNLRSIMAPPLLIAGSATLMDALKMLQRNKAHLAIVLDEYGGTSGIITLEDILEELVGEIYDEHDDFKEYYTQVEENIYLASGDAYLEELFEKFLRMPYTPESESSTLSGWLFEQFKTLPAVGAALEWGPLRFEVVKVMGQRIDKVRIVKNPNYTFDEEGEDDSVLML